MKTRFAFIGFRHQDSFELLKAVRERSDCQVVACCEEDAATREELASIYRVKITHDDFATMLREVEIDVIAIGDRYARRGALAIQGLRSGRHVVTTAPLCAAISELARITDFTREQNLSVGIQLNNRDSGAFRTLRELIQGGEIGEVTTVSVAGQHPLQLASRPAWFFAPGEHPGPINDLGLHAFDLVSWLTGLSWKEVVAARSWNAKAVGIPHFRDAAQFMAVLENGAGVQVDVSYLAPDKAAYQLPGFWNVVVHGTWGRLETHQRASQVSVVLDHYDGPDLRAAATGHPRRYLEDFLREIRGQLTDCELRTGDCLRATRLAVETQRRAGA